MLLVAEWPTQKHKWPYLEPLSGLCVLGYCRNMMLQHGGLSGWGHAPYVEINNSGYYTPNNTYLNYCKTSIENLVPVKCQVPFTSPVWLHILTNKGLSQIEAWSGWQIFMQVTVILVQINNLIVFPIFAEKQFCVKGIKGLSQI